MNSLRPDYSEFDMKSAIRSKCSEVKKQMAINHRKKIIAQDSVFKRRGNANSNVFSNSVNFPLNGFVSHSNYNGDNNNNNSSYNGDNNDNGDSNCLFDESSLECFQDTE